MNKITAFQRSNSLQQQVVHIVSTNSEQSHIYALINELDCLGVPVEIHDTSHRLSLPLDRRYFIVVDNFAGIVSLDPWFASQLLFIVGYPKKGKNSKNHYCSTATEVYEKYLQYTRLPEFARKTNINSKLASKSIHKKVNSIVTSNQSSELSQQGKSNQEKGTKISLNALPKLKIGDKSRIFLFLSRQDNDFNSWILKVSVRYPKRFAVIQTTSQIVRSSHSLQNNHLLVIENHQFLTHQKYLSNIRIIIYNRDYLRSINKKNIQANCQSIEGLTKNLNRLGFQNFTDFFEKSIDEIRLSYLQEKNQQLSRRKSIQWRNQIGRNHHFDKKKSVDYQAKEQGLKSNDQSNNQMTQRFNNQSIQAHKDQSSQYSTKDQKKQPTSKKRNNKKNQINKLFSSLYGPLVYRTHQNMNGAAKELTKRLKRTTSYIRQVPRVSAEMGSQILCHYNYKPLKKEEQDIQQEAGYKARKLRARVNSDLSFYSSGLNEQPKIGKIVTKGDQKENIQMKNSSKQQIFKQGQIVFKDNQFNINHMQILSQKTNIQTPIQIRKKKKNAQSKKTSLMDENLSFSSIAIEFNQKNTKFKVQKLFPKTENTDEKNKKLNIISIPQTKSFRTKSLLKAGFDENHFMSSTTLLWKQRNGNKTSGLELLEKLSNGKEIFKSSFYTRQEFQTSLVQSGGQKNLLIFIDDSNASSFVSALNEFLRDHYVNVVFLCVFEKNVRITREELQNLQRIITTTTGQTKIMIKPVRSLEYLDGNLEIAKMVAKMAGNCA